MIVFGSFKFSALMSGGYFKRIYYFSRCERADKDDSHKKKYNRVLKIVGQAWWLTPVILASWEVVIEKIVVLGQARQRASEIPSQPASWVWWCPFVILAMYNKNTYYICCMFLSLIAT
jgi:hypothetical protein